MACYQPRSDSIYTWRAIRDVPTGFSTYRQKSIEKQETETTHRNYNKIRN